MSTVFSTLRLLAGLMFLVVNTLMHASVLFSVALLKALIPMASFRRVCGRFLVRVAESWIGANNVWIDRMLPTRIHAAFPLDLASDTTTLVLANHQSWVDIFVLQYLFNRRIPFMRFFLKSSLIFVPVIGLAWWALDFPFMKRYSREAIAKNPALAGRDLEVTRRACAKFRGMPASIMNFVEGTRFTPAKHAAQNSPYPHLLKPKAGGVAFVLGAMGDSIAQVLDVTIAYSGARPTLTRFLAGEVADITVDVHRLEIPQEFLGADYQNDAAFRARFQEWINARWAEKEAQLAQRSST